MRAWSAGPAAVGIGMGLLDVRQQGAKNGFVRFDAFRS